MSYCWFRNFRDAEPFTATTQVVNDLYAATSEMLVHQYVPELFRPITERLQLKNFDIDEQTSIRELDIRRGILKETNYFQLYENFLDQVRTLGSTCRSFLTAQKIVILFLFSISSGKRFSTCVLLMRRTI